MRADEVTHVLDDADHGDADALEHLRATQRIPHGHLLGRRDDQRAVEAHDLRQRQLCVACPRRQVDEKILQLAPRDVVHELPDDLHDDRAAPNRGRITLHDEAERHQLDAVRLERLDLAALDFGLAGDAEHARDVGPIDVGIHQADAVAVTCQRGGEVRGHCGFPDAALAARDCEHSAESRHLIRRRRRRRCGGRTAGRPGGSLPATIG